VTANRCAGGPLFEDSHDRATLIAILAAVVRRHDWTCTSYCLMTTHFHLMLTTPEADLDAGMQRLNGQYATSFNRRHGGAGHVFARRYGAELIQSDGHLLETCRYVALNPVRAGLCVAPEDWRWSSFRATMGEEPAPNFLDTDSLLRLFGPTDRVARARFRAFVDDANPLQGLTP
jgi:REP element-mobilizing transposase RayT